MMQNYTVYHLHSELSLLDSCTNYKLYIDKAKEYGMTAIGFSEHGRIFNWVGKKQYCDELGIKYIHGCEVYLTERLEPKVRDNYHTVLIATDYDSLLELNKLISMSSDEQHMYYKPRISFNEFLNISDKIISTSACLASPLNQLPKDNPYYEKLAQKYTYYEIQPHISSDQANYNKYLYELSRKYNKPLIVGTDTHSLNKYKAECRSILQKAKDIEYTNEDSFDLTFKSYDELIDMFKKQNVLPEDVYMKAITNTNVMADKVKDVQLDKSLKYPDLYDDEEKSFKDTIQQKNKEKVNNNIIPDNDIYKQRIAEEYKVFKKLGMFSFMLFMSELITWCHDNDIPTGFCRGSVGGSLIAYILDIIDLNPIQWNTVFSRFANEDRVSLGDIDIDFDPRDREKVYQYIINRFGNNKTAYILTTNTISDKGTIDEIGRALKYDLNLVAKIKEEYELNPQDTREKYPGLFYYFDGLKGTAISQGIHPAGIVASPITLNDNVGTFHYNNKIVTQINMDELHDLNYVKYDILGLKNIGIIKDTYKLIGSHYLKSHEINWNDKKVWDDIITSPVGIFQFEGDYAFKLLKDYKPQRINDLSLVNAALRPSGDSYRNDLIAHKFHQNPSPQIDELLKDNNGFLVFQEDTIKFLTDICGFSGSMADSVRRAIGQKKEKELKEYLPKILDGYCNKSSKSRNIAEEEAKQFIQIISDSSDYQFGYNHSTGYSMIGYNCAMLRYYHPLAFTTAYLNNADNEKDKQEGTKLAAQKGITVNPIKFRHSKGDYFFDKETNSIYKGISSIKYCNAEIGEQLYALRDKKYESFVDLLIDLEENSNLNSRQTKILITLDFFKEFGHNGKLLNIYKEFTEGQWRYDKKHKSATKIKRIFLLKQLENSIEDTKLSIKEQLNFEKEVLGYMQTTYDLPNRYVYIYKLDIKYDAQDKKKMYSPKLGCYCLANGKTQMMKIKAKDYKKNPVKQDSIILLSKCHHQPKTKKTENGFEQIPGSIEWWIDSYQIKNLQ